MSSDGNWVTLNGVHVLIDSKGTVLKGPSKFIGKDVNNISKSNKQPNKSEYTKTESIGKVGTDFTHKDSNIMSDSEILSDLNSKGIDSVESAIEKQGFDGKPRTMKSDEFDNYIKKDGIHLSRGISANSEQEADKYINELKNGDFYVAGGEAYFGSGLYCFGGDSLNQASNYAKGSGGKTIDIALSKDSKILEITKDNIRSKQSIEAYNKNSESWEFYYSLLRNPSLSSTQETLKKAGYKLPEEPDIDIMFKKGAGEYLKQENKYNMEVSKLAGDYIRKSLPKEDLENFFSYEKTTVNNIIATSKGYDAIKLSSDYVNENSSNGTQEIWIVFNRTKLVIKEE